MDVEGGLFVLPAPMSLKNGNNIYGLLPLLFYPINVCYIWESEEFKAETIVKSYPLPILQKLSTRLNSRLSPENASSISSAAGLLESIHLA